MSRLSIILLSLLAVACNNPGSGSGLAAAPADGSRSLASGDSTDSEDPYVYFNTLRTGAGMRELLRDDDLALASLRHARYLDANDVLGHQELAEFGGFTGAYVPDRIAAAGYRTRWASEVIADGKSAQQALDLLMGAIYHRMAMLDITMDRVGISFLDSAKGADFLVANFSNSLLNALCQSPDTGKPMISGQCTPDTAISRQAFDQAKSEVALTNPAMIVWPATDATDIPPAFFAEEPDPLPDYAVSGYPVSVQFNDARVGSWSVTALRLYDLEAGNYVDETRLLDQTTDPNQVLRRNEYALFPLKRLEWGRRYRVELEYVADQTAQFKTWEFTTRELNGNVSRIVADTDTVSIPNHATSNLYFVPADPLQSLTAYRYLYPVTATVSFANVDHNTIAVSVDAAAGDRITLAFTDGRELTLVVEHQVISSR